jgi:hypothetical protein
LTDGVAERLGCIEMQVGHASLHSPLVVPNVSQEVKRRDSGVQVFELKETSFGPSGPPVLSLESLKVGMNEEQATMKGAFRSVTTLGYDA